MKKIVKVVLYCCILFNTSYGFAKELLIATTLSTDATAHIIKKWEETQKNISINTLNRTSNSIERLVDSPFNNKIDLILTSSPMLMDHLREGKHLEAIPLNIDENINRFIPERLNNFVVPIALSGFGILSNKTYLNNNSLNIPITWEDLTQSSYQELVLMSSPSRSDTNHLMIEAVLQQYGWEKGWELLLKIGGNLATISSRSFSVGSKIKTGVGAIGITIDNYAFLLADDSNLVFHYLPTNVVSPTFIAVSANSQHKEEAFQFIQFLLSPEGQKIISDPETGKYPVYQLPPTSPLFQQQIRLLQTNDIDYDLVIKRQDLVKLLFDTAITFRLNQLKENWKLLYDVENKKQQKLTDIEKLLTQVPVTAEQANDANYYTQFSQSVNKSRLTVIQWQAFFQTNNQKVIDELEKQNASF
ncbi:ABC transporter substrate-binding protein [Orbaceae bacterium ac157xtp]